MLARLARVFLVVALLAGWQAALAHSVEHGSGSHEDGPRCGVLEGLTACAAASIHGNTPARADYDRPPIPFKAPRIAERPPFLSQGPPALA